MTQQQKLQAAPPAKPTPAAPLQLPAGLTAAHFTARELETIRAICRDADNELGVRMLRDALARAEGGK